MPSATRRSHPIPEVLTAEMRKAGEAVKTPITLADVPYLDALWAAWRPFLVADEEKKSDAA
jgi:hypothetical protein